MTIDAVGSDHVAREVLAMTGRIVAGGGAA
jgi:hypothetical protein